MTQDTDRGRVPILTREWYCPHCEHTWPEADGPTHDCAKDDPK